MKTPRLLPVLLAFCMFSTGASGLVNEYVLATITTYILGNSIEQFSIVIASMMLMMGISGFVQSRMSDNNLIYKFIGVEVVMAVLGGFAPLAIYGAFAYFEYNFAVVHYFFVLSVGFLIGFEIPIVMRIINQQQISLKTNLAIVYAMDYVGAFVGAIIWVKILLKFYPLTEISFIVAGFNFAIALITVTYFIFTGIIKHRVTTAIIMLMTVLILVVGYLNNRDISSLFEQHFYDDPIILKTTTKYQHIVLTENKQLGDIRLYINGNTQFSSLDEKRYHDLLVHPVMSIANMPEHALILGGGDGLALRELLKYKNLKSITLVDLDPDMIKLASENPRLRKLNKDAFQNARLHVRPPGNVNAVNVKGVYLESEDSWTKKLQSEWVATVDVYTIDADQFIRSKNDQRWDVVIIDFPDPSSVELSKLYSKQFYRKLRTHLTSNAFVSIQSTSPYHSKESFLTIGNTLRSAGFNVLPYRQNIPSFGDWGFHLAWTSSESEKAIKNSLKTIETFIVNTDYVTPELMLASFAFGKGELTSKTNCVNTVMFPCLLTNYTNYGWQVD
ncbi:MAG: polyamine aminopropyltransferase [Gammaproteobacteria bacterium]|nr:polyamine aminopropyltransferase [Gammaproteobacteria bacterium]